jgi:hypothetical protein
LSWTVFAFVNNRRRSENCSQAALSVPVPIPAHGAAVSAALRARQSCVSRSPVDVQPAPFPVVLLSQPFLPPKNFAPKLKGHHLFWMMAVFESDFGYIIRWFGLFLLLWE